MPQTINKIEFYDGNVKVGEFTSDIIFTSDMPTINKQRVRRLRRVVAENMYQPEHNIGCIVYDQENNVLFQL